MDIKNIHFGWDTAYGDSDDAGQEQVVPVSTWFKCGEFDDGRATLELRALTSTNLEVRVVIQFANNPDQTTFTQKEITGWTSVEGILYPDVWTDLTNETKQNQIGRVCIEGRRKATTGDGLELVRVAGRTELKTC